ncbi:hypothetical protein R1sor_000136 [Riccia sorocarpa]|uniref:Uncharacterized protein n=1 Tax=Riccia sorocarpa TaxID=122646 RepID=A0ABD3GYA8_9MARC
MRRRALDLPPDPRRGRPSLGTVGRGHGRVVGGGGCGRGRGRGQGAESESESDSAGEAAHDPLGRPRRPLRRRIVEDILSEDVEEEEEEPEHQEGAKPRRQVRENPLPERPY